MPVRLSVVLSSPSLAAADPVVVSGADNLDRLVRWVHSSEVLDIAPLLHGGELLLTGGAVLAGSTAAERRRYIRELAARRVAGVAIETGGRLPSIPADMLEEAAAHGFPLVELRRVVPFVDVTEAVNGALVDSSITRLKYSAELTHVLSGIVADGGGAQQIVEALAAQISVPVALFDGAGGVLASSPGTAGPGTAGRNRPDARRAGITSPVSVRGVHAATLALYPDDDADLELLHLAADRGSESLAFSLLRSRPPTTRDLAESELVRLAGSTAPELERVRHLGRLIGLDVGAPVVGIVGASSDGPTGLPRLDRLLHRYGRTVTDRPTESELHVIVSFDGRRGAGELRTELLAGLADWAGTHAATTLVIGPAFPDLSGAPMSLSAALETIGRPRGENHGIVDAQHHTLARLFADDGRQPLLERIVDEQLSLFTGTRPRDRDLLLESLEAYFEAGCNKSAAATRLHVERQTLHARLQRAFRIIGGDPSGTPAALSLHVALRLRTIQILGASRQRSTGL